MKTFRWLVIGALAATHVGCGESKEPDDAGTSSDAAMQDAEPMTDTSPPEDSTVEPDSAPEDAGGDAEPEDAAVEVDASMDSQVPVDTGPPDTGPPDVPASVRCTNGMMDFAETDVDCGGPECEPCETGSCLIGADCASGVCRNRMCQEETCFDGVLNGDETSADCGGPDCARCWFGDRCLGNGDCIVEATCTNDVCVANHCFDSMHNESETDVDCGGPRCGPCMEGQGCARSFDCVTGTACADGLCRSLDCSNGELDGDELQIDCGGGECLGCPDGTMCNFDYDCASDRCEGTFCVSCEDGSQNGDETDEDCGGSQCSRRCAGGEACVEHGDCASGVCTGMICEGPTVYYSERFSGGDGGWTTGGNNSSWAFGQATGSVINSPPNGNAVWVTNPAGNHNNFEDSWAQSPSFDLSGATGDPLLEFDLIYDTENRFDEAWLEVSIDGGMTWQKLIDPGGAENWYNDLGNQWWEASSGGWVRARISLTGTAGASDVRIRFFFSSDQSIVNDGISFDDVLVIEDECANNMLDPGERDIDCGGLCGACADGRSCMLGEDCLSGNCESMVCVSCRDGMLNGDEVQVDCGGSCGLCPEGTPCTDGSLCASGECESMMCTEVGVLYEEHFDSDNGFWTTGGTASSWEHGVPAAMNIPAAASPAQAWVTNLTGDHNNDELSWLQSPPIDLTGALDDPVLSFSIIRFTEGCCDEAWLEVSIDGGSTWSKVLAAGSPANWYNDTNNQWWDGDTAAWETASTTLTGTAQEPDVRIRFVFSSDESVTEEGIGIDDVRIDPAT